MIRNPLPEMLSAGLLAALLVAAPRASESATLPPNFVETQLASGLGPLTAFAELPDGRAFLADKLGRVRIWALSGSNDTALVVPNIYTVGEAGLIGVAVDPAWPVKPYVYVHYNRNAPRNLIIARYRATGELSDPQSVDVMLADPYIILEVDDQGPNHNGGCLRFDSTGLLYAAFGEDFLSCVAQDSTTLKGIIARLTLENLPDSGSGPPPHSLLTPPGNPFAPDTTGAELVWCFGLRNPFRFTIDPYTDLLYIGDVGGNTYEEVDIVSGGENFGWPIWEADTTTGVHCFRPLATFTRPIITYHHETSDPVGGSGNYAIIGGPRYRGGAIPQRFPLEYEGIYFYADVIKGWVRCAQESGGGWIPFLVPGQADSVNWAKGLGNITDLQQGADGNLRYVNLNGDYRKIAYVGPVSATPDAVRSSPVRARPNPFLAGTRTTFDGLTGPLTVFDAQGRRIRRLELPTWDGRDEEGRRVSPGPYWVSGASGRPLKVIVTR